MKSNIPKFLKSRTASGLQRSFLALSAKTGKAYKIISITFDGQNWYGWFYQDTDILQEALSTSNLMAGDEDNGS